MGFQEVYKALNSEQRQAVDIIDGPMLVLAGPGTGKTQLLSARVANILQLTDTLPENILCLTFTENGATNMRERLTRFIGQAAHDVQIATYHSFGAELIRRYPEYFGEHRLQNAIDDLGKLQVLASIVESLPYDNPLKFTAYCLGDLSSTLSDIKRGLLSSDALRSIAKNNEHCYKTLNKELLTIFSGLTTLPRTYAKSVIYYDKIFTVLRNIASKQSTGLPIKSLAEHAYIELDDGLRGAQETGKTTSLTKWKNKWLEKNAEGQFVLAGSQSTRRLLALADVLDSYEDHLSTNGLYDFDDMILRCIATLSSNDALRFKLQEQYLYLLLDEFQDTNAAQLKLVELLTNNPASFGRPNVMAVGDDDQAIYAFQGAHTSNMLDFYALYQDTHVINLVESYRSHKDILDVAHNIAEQIESRLHHQFKNFTKVLQAKNAALPPDSTIERHEFISDIEQSAWIASRINQLISEGVNPSEIAVLAPKHKVLEPLVPFLKSNDVPISYEKRENILEAPSVQLLLDMAKLITALQENNNAVADHLWPKVLSDTLWDIPTRDLWNISWQVSDSRGKTNWTKSLLEHPIKNIQDIADFMLELARRSNNESLETMLDYMAGLIPIAIEGDQPQEITSPLYGYFTSHGSEILYETLSHLSVLRANLRAYQKTKVATLTLNDLLQYVSLYDIANSRMINTNPYHQHENAVQLMTVFKAKGLEFEYVFLPSCLDDVWGSSTRDNTNKIGLPLNVSILRHAGATNDERLRAFFVAITRAKHGLFLCNYAKKFNGKTTRGLQYLHEEQAKDGVAISNLLPEKSKAVLHSKITQLPLKHLELAWQDRHVKATSSASLQALLKERLQTYQLSPTHINTFVDTAYGGPESFFFKTLLRFPAAPTPDGQFGNAVHETLEWLQHEVNKGNNLPSNDQAIRYLITSMESKKLLPDVTKLLIARGKHALQVLLNGQYIDFKKEYVAEYSFKREGVFVGNAHLSGKIDRLEIDKKTKTIKIVDYKTGKSFKTWKPELKLHKYKQQLYCYKFLIEHSHTFQGYSVTGAELLFVEPDENNTVHTLSLAFKPDEEKNMRLLIESIWQHIKALNLPNIEAYDSSLSGTKKFEDDLINGTV